MSPSQHPFAHSGDWRCPQHCEGVERRVEARSHLQRSSKISPSFSRAPFPSVFPHETGYTSYIKRKSWQLGSIPHFFLGLCSPKPRVWSASRAYQCVHLRLRAQRSGHVLVECLSLSPPSPSSGRGVGLYSHMCFLFSHFFFFGGAGVVGSGDNRVYLLLKRKREKPQRHFTAVH